MYSRIKKSEKDKNKGGYKIKLRIKNSKKPGFRPNTSLHVRGIYGRKEFQPNKQKVDIRKKFVSPKVCTKNHNNS